MREMSVKCIVRMWDTYLVRFLPFPFPERQLTLHPPFFSVRARTIDRRKEVTRFQNFTFMSASLSSSSGAIS
jgi:hypothetical protein